MAAGAGAEGTSTLLWVEIEGAGAGEGIAKLAASGRAQIESAAKRSFILRRNTIIQILVVSRAWR
jgi:hypothetical protein